MKVTSFIAAIAVCVSAATALSANAQTAPAKPPVPPTPVAVPEPARAPKPAAAPRGKTPDYYDDLYLSGQLRYDLDRAKIGEDVKAAMRDGQIQAEKAAAMAQDRMNDLKFNFDGYAPMAQAAIERSKEMVSNLSSTLSAKVSGDISSAYSMAYAAAPLAQTRWQDDWKQDSDPADSVYRTAYDAMNRGDWRRAADLFSQVYAKYPKSTRVSSATYYEAFMNYRIGTTESLRTALKLLTDRTRMDAATASSNAASTASSNSIRPGGTLGGRPASVGYGVSYSSSSNNANEWNVLTTRVRGALAARGDQDASNQLKADAQKNPTCDTEDMQVRAEALSALAQSDMVAATPMLRRVLDKKEPCTLELRRRALSILLRRADTAATSAAISVAKNNDETLELRVDAIQYLSRLPGDNALSTLEDLLRTSQDREIQSAAVRSLSNSENPRARQAVRALIERNDVSEQLRSDAIGSFSKERSSDADMAYLRSLYPKLQSERLKTSVLSAMSRIGGPENEQFLLSVAKNTGESSDVRAAAISRMMRTSSVSIADLGKLYDAAESRAIREQIISVYGSRQEPETVDKLIEILKNGTDPRLRGQAVNALSRKNDPRAKKALADFMGNGQ